MFKITKGLLVLMGLLIVLSACDDDAGDSLDGEWVSDCIVLQENSAIYTRSYTGRSFTAVAEGFSGSDCSMKLGATKLTGTFRVGDADSQLPQPIDMTVTGATITLFSAARVDVFNAGTRFDYDDWALEEEKDILGRQGPQNLVLEGDVLLGIFFVSADGNTLQVGERDLLEKYNRIRQSDRATELDPTNFSKVQVAE